MPNWCYTTIKFHGNEEEIKGFHDKLNEWTSKNFEENGFGFGWLGNVVHGAGLEDRISNDDKNLKRIRCRGQIEIIGEIEYMDEDVTFIVDMYSAWMSCINMWIEVIKTLNYESIKFSYIAHEPLMALYAIYDPFDDWPDRYCVDIYVGEKDERNDKLTKLRDNPYHSSKEHLIEKLRELLSTDETDFGKLAEIASKHKWEDEDTYVLPMKYELLDSPEWG